MCIVCGFHSHFAYSCDESMEYPGVSTDHGVVGRVCAEAGRITPLNLAGVFMFLCIVSALSDLSGLGRSSLLGKLLQGTPMLVGNLLAALWLVRTRRLYITGVARTVVPVAILMCVVGILLVPVAWLTVGVVYPIYVGGDLAWVLWLCLNLIVFGTIRDTSAIPIAEIYRCYCLLTSLLASHWIASSIRHRSLLVPHLVLFAFLLAGLAVECTCSHRLFRHAIPYLVVCLGALVLAFFGWSRGLFLGFVAASLLCLLLIVNRKNTGVLIVLSGILIPLGGALFHTSGSALQESRLYATFKAGEFTQGASMLERLAEIHSAVRTLALAPGSVLTGLGHGAVFVPHAELGSVSRNLTPAGHVHNIHVGPAMLWFRYGLLGIIFYVLVWISLLRGFLLARAISRIAGSAYFVRTRYAYCILRIFYTGYFTLCILFVYSHFGNHFVNPFFALSLSTTVLFVSRPHLLVVPDQRPS